MIGASREYCTSIYQQQYQVEINAGHLCAVGIEGRDTCDGDGGAPLMTFNDTDPMEKYWSLAGVTSFGARVCGTEGYPSVFARISYYHDWILSKLQWQTQMFYFQFILEKFAWTCVN